MTGSHADAIPLAGAYDGTLGIIGPIEAVRALNASGYVPLRPIDILMFTSEEPTRFGLGCIGRSAAGVSTLVPVCSWETAAVCCWVHYQAVLIGVNLEVGCLGPGGAVCHQFVRRCRACLSQPQPSACRDRRRWGFNHNHSVVRRSSTSKHYTNIVRLTAHVLMHHCAAEAWRAHFPRRLCQRQGMRMAPASETRHPQPATPAAAYRFHIHSRLFDNRAKTYLAHVRSTMPACPRTAQLCESRGSP